MKNNHTIILALVIILLSIFSRPLSAQFFYNETCRYATGLFQYYGDAVGYTAGLGIDPVGDGWLRLTQTQSFQNGYVLLDKTFPSTMGVTLEFDFKIWTNVSNRSIADGISVFLFDGNPDSTFQIGGLGGLLGYINLHPAYLGIGIDEFGNFPNPAHMPGSPGLTPQAITIAKADYTWVAGTAANLGTGTNLGYTTAVNTRPTDLTIYRRIRIDIEPILGGMSVNVSLKTTPTGNFVQILGPVNVIQPTPSFLGMGFCGNNGYNFAYHEVRNVVIRTPGDISVFKSINKCLPSKNNAVINTIITNNTNDSVIGISVIDTLPAGFIIMDSIPIVSSGIMRNFTITTLGNNCLVCSYTIDVDANNIVYITYNGVFTVLSPNGQYSSSASITPPNNSNDNNTNDNYTTIIDMFNVLSPTDTNIFLIGDSVILTVNADSAQVLSYTWEQSIDNGVNWVTLSSITPSYTYLGQTPCSIRCIALWNSGCQDTAVFNCFIVPDNISDADCYVEPIGDVFNIRQISKTLGHIDPYYIPVIGDVDNDGKIEIIVAKTYMDYRAKDLLIVDGTTGLAKDSIQTPTINYISGIAIYKVEDTTYILVPAAFDYSVSADQLYLFAYKYNTIMNTWQQAWKSAYPYNHNIAPNCPIVADLDGDGMAEIIIGGRIFNAKTGNLLADFPSGITTASQVSTIGVGDILNNGSQQLAIANTIYSLQFTNKNSYNANAFTLEATAPVSAFPLDRNTALADFNMDGYLDVLIVGPKVLHVLGTSTIVYGIWDVYNNRFLGGNTFETPPQTSFGGYQLNASVPFIGDVNGDGLLEFVFMTYDNLFCFRYIPNMDVIEQYWIYSVNDHSGQTGITLFDFNQDKKAELVYRDEGRIRILDGSVKNNCQEIKYFTGVCSGTGLEYPIVADVNQDGQAEIITIGSDNMLSIHGYLYIFGAGNGTSWAPARKVWNQYAYNSVNVNEDLTIPRYQLNPATVFPGKDGILGTADDVRPYNGYLMQQTILNKNGNPLWLAPDATFAGDPVFNYYAAGDSLVISLSVTNLGDASLQPPFYVSTYKNIMHGANKLTTDSIVNLIYPEDTSAVRIVVHNISSHLPIDSIIISLNDKGQAIIIQQECDTSNNIVVKEFSETLETINDSICYGETYNRNRLNFIALQDTIVIVKITLGDGRDSLVRLQIHVLDTSLCVFYDTINLGESSYSKFGFSLPSDSLKHTGTNLYTVKNINSFGCDSIHLLYLTIGQIWLFSDTMFLCQYDSGMWRNKSLQTSMSGSFTVWDSLKTGQGFDSLYRLMLMIQPTYLFDDTLVVCRDAVAEWRNRTLSTSTVGMFTIWDSLKTLSLGCDSLYRLTLTILPTYFFDDTLSVCHKAIINWHGIQLPTAISGIFILWDSLKTSHYGCDSIYKLTLLVNTIPNFEIKTEEDICENDSIKLYVDVENVFCQWTTGDTSNYTFVCQNGVYGVSVSIEGCTTLQDIHIECPCDLWLPNIFTPNRDPFNEEFFPVPSSDLSSFSMYIYDRWGSLIYKTDTLTPWNGTYKGREAAAGVYYCVVHYSCTKDPAKKRTKQGSVTLVR